MNQQAMYGSRSNTTHAKESLPLHYNDNIKMKQILSTKIMPNIPKQHGFNHESDLAKNHQWMINTQNEEFDTHTTILQTKD